MRHKNILYATKPTINLNFYLSVLKVNIIMPYVQHIRVMSVT